MTEHVEAEKKHSQLGASTAERIMLCPGSVKLIRALKKEGLIPPVSKPSIYAAEGTAAHLVGALLLTEELLEQKNKSVNEGDFVKVGDYGFEVNAEMLEAVQVYVQHCLNIVQTYPEVDYWIEEEVCLRHLSPTELEEDEMWGTPDFVGYVPGIKLEVVDYKHGKGHGVSPENNVQLQYYALAAVEKHTELKTYHVPEIWMTIVQPRHFAGGVSTHVITWEELMEFKKQLVSAMDLAVNSEAPPLIPGEKQCQWCPAKNKCPALRGQLEEATQKDFALITVDTELAAPASLTLEQKLRLYHLRTLFDAWFNGIEEDIKRAAMMGVETPGVKVVRTEPNYKPVEGAALTLAEFLPEDDFMKPPQLKSKTDIQKLLKKYNVNLDISELFYRPEGNLVLAPESDRRPRVDPMEINEDDH